MRMHARDRLSQYTQRTVVAVCGMKSKTEQTIYVGLISSVMRSDVTCTGCRAILREREREAQRAGTPGQHETKEGPKQ